MSYAHQGSKEDSNVQRFFQDLCNDVRVIAGTTEDAEVGFLDVDMLRAGAQWSPELCRALATCQVFIALCSPLYFRRDACGREWAVFSARLDAYRAANDERPPALLPVFWVPTTDLPPVATDLQYEDHHFGPGYVKHRLRQLIRLDRYRDDYRDFLYALANQITLVADRFAIPPSPVVPDFNAISPAFGEPTQTPPRTPPPRTPRSHPDRGRPAAPARKKRSIPVELPRLRIDQDTHAASHGENQRIDGSWPPDADQ